MMISILSDIQMCIRGETFSSVDDSLKTQFILQINRVCDGTNDFSCLTYTSQKMASSTTKRNILTRETSVLTKH